jgi:hypothetical protein
MLFLTFPAVAGAATAFLVLLAFLLLASLLILAVLF